MESMENLAVQTEEIATQNPQQVGQPEPKKNDDSVVGFGAFLGSEILISLPVIGLISSIVMSIAAKKKSFKNYALSKMTWILIKGALSVVSTLLVLSIIGTSVVALLNSSFGTNFDNIFSLIGTAVDIKKGNYSPAVAQLEGIAPSELKPFVKELGSGEYEPLLQMLANKEYDVLLDEVKSDKYPELMSKLDKETFNTVVEELEKAADGEILPWMEKIEKFIEKGVLGFIL